MTGRNVALGLLAAALAGGVLALWWRYGLLIVLNEPTWFCFSR